ncbi:MAG: hypothetical protein KAS30_02795 [Candidatus Diapherotrites archaeon]|nr:hypothetical protein [Candidatus Diapherotrites archaeon]
MVLIGKKFEFIFICFIFIFCFFAFVEAKFAEVDTVINVSVLDYDVTVNQQVELVRHEYRNFNQHVKDEVIASCELDDNGKCVLNSNLMVGCAGGYCPNYSVRFNGELKTLNLTQSVSDFDNLFETTIIFKDKNVDGLINENNSGMIVGGLFFIIIGFVIFFIFKKKNDN